MVSRARGVPGFAWKLDPADPQGESASNGRAPMEDDLDWRRAAAD